MEMVSIKYKTDVHSPPEQAGVAGETKKVPPHVAKRLVDDSHGIVAEYVKEPTTKPKPAAKEEQAQRSEP